MVPIDPLHPNRTERGAVRLRGLHHAQRQIGLRDPVRLQRNFAEHGHNPSAAAAGGRAIAARGQPLRAIRGKNQAAARKGTRLRHRLLIARPQQQREVDELSETQCQRRRHQDLPDQRAGPQSPQKPHDVRTSAANRYPPPHTVLMSAGLRGSASIFLRSRLI